MLMNKVEIKWNWQKNKTKKPLSDSLDFYRSKGSELINVTAILHTIKEEVGGLEENS